MSDVGSRTQPTVLLCGGKDCRRRHGEAYDTLASRLAGAGVDVREVRCLGSCSGPTAVLTVRGRTASFERLRKPKAQKDLVALASGELSRPTARLDVRALAGSRLRKVEARLQRRGVRP